MEVDLRANAAGACGHFGANHYRNASYEQLSPKRREVHRHIILAYKDLWYRPFSEDARNVRFCPLQQKDVVALMWRVRIAAG
jgi:hypothetical protein